jgi:hypothetical protein
MREADVFQAFVGKWVASAEPVSDLALRELENQLKLALPAAYRRFVTQHGTSYCPGLLSAIVDGQHEFHDLQQFVAVGEIAEATAMYESGGMEFGFVGFASDCMGNMFLFKREDCTPGAEDAAVWFFDHDFVSIEAEAPSFLEWLRRYAEIESIGEE